MAKYKKSLKELWAEEVERMKPMTWPKRIDHLWTYYREYLWIGAVVVILLGAMITSLFNLTKETVVTGMMVNITVEQEGMNYLEREYAEYIGANPRRENVKLEYTAFGTLEEQANSEQNYYAAMTVVGEVSAKMLDYIILDKAGMEFYISQGVYLDLREFFTPEELSQLEAENRLIFAQEEGSDDRWVMAVDITELPYVQDNVTSEGPVYFALSGSTQRLEACRDIWEYLHLWQS